MSRLSTVWTKHLRSKEDKDNFELILRNSTQILTRLRDIIAEREKELEAQETKLSDYETPGWAYKEAHRLGRKAELRSLKELLDFIG